MIIRCLSPSDVRDYRRLRLRGLRANPAAFGSSYSEEVKKPARAFVARLEQTASRWTFGAFEERRLVGILTLVRDEGKKSRHKASLVGMYVERTMRRKGVGRALLTRALETAQQLRGLRQVRLAAVETNHPALRLYESAGFKVYGREEAALLVAGKFHAELFLARRL